MGDQDKVFVKATWRLVPFMVLLYVVAYLDRVNVGFAALTMNTDLGLTAAMYGFGAGIFFFGYFLFEVPSNVIMEKVGARLWICRIMLTWGVLSMATAFVTGPWSFYVVRFLLGLAEAGFFPGMVLYLTYWYPSAWRARLISLFLAAVPLANVIGGPLSLDILGRMHGLLALHGWQWLFLVEGLPSVALGVMVLWWMPNGPRDAKWLSDDERCTIETALAAEPAAQHTRLMPMFLDPRVWLLAIPDFGIVLGLYGVNLWLPQIVSGMGFGWWTGFIVAAPYLVAVFVMVLWGRSSDARHERVWHISSAALLGAAGLVGAMVFTSPLAVLLSLGVAICGTYAALAVFWTLPPSFLGGTAAAGGIALINSISNLGGFFGPAIMGSLKDLTGNYTAGLGVLAGGMIVAAVLVVLVGRTLTFAGRAHAMERFTRLNA